MSPKIELSAKIRAGFCIKDGIDPIIVSVLNSEVKSDVQQ